MRMILNFFYQIFTMNADKMLKNILKLSRKVYGKQ